MQTSSVSRELMKEYIVSLEEEVDFDYREATHKLARNCHFNGECIELGDPSRIRGIRHAHARSRNVLVDVLRSNDKTHTTTTLSRLLYAIDNNGRIAPNFRVGHMCGNQKCVTSGHTGYLLTLHDSAYCDWCDQVTQRSVVITHSEQGVDRIFACCSNPHGVGTGGSGLSSHIISTRDELERVLKNA